MRKFTKAHLEIRRLSVTDILWLFVYLVLVSFSLYFNFFKDKMSFLVVLVTSAFFAFVILTTPFGLRFRSIYFSIIWMVFSLLFMLNMVSEAFEPFLLFVLYHVIRLIFWRTYHREFIPFTVVKGHMYRYVSKIEHKGGTDIDKYYMKLLGVGGLVITILCFVRLIE